MFEEEKIGVIKTTEGEIPQKILNGNFRNKTSFFSFPYLNQYPCIRARIQFYKKGPDYITEADEKVPSGKYSSHYVLPISRTDI